MQAFTPRSSLTDPVLGGLACGWKVFGGEQTVAAPVLDCDVAIVGTGGGGGITAELLTTASLRPVLIEKGPLKTSTDFRQIEAEAYPALHQQRAGNKTADISINSLQRRFVGGSTTVNLTSSFCTPATTLQLWKQRLHLPGTTEDFMSPWFAQVEQRLSIGPWTLTPDANNQLLQQCAARLGIPAAAIMHNVKGCWNLGSCGIGCPTNAKQSMLVTTLPKALDAGATLLVQARALRVVLKQGRAVGVICQAVGMHGTPLAAATTRVHARHRVVAGGAINFPPSLHPVMASTALTGCSKEQAQALPDFPRTHAVLALMRDGFNEQSSGDQVTLHDNGTPSLDYALNDYVRNAARRALLSRAEIQSTACARHVQPLHQMARPCTSWQQAREAIAPFGARRLGVPHQHRRASATARLRCAYMLATGLARSPAGRSVGLVWVAAFLHSGPAVSG